MSNSNGIITTPIDIDSDIYPVLGLSSASHGYDLGYACSNSHSLINPWSKYKPVRYPKDGTLTEQEFKNTNYGMQRFKVDTANLGCSNPFIYLPPIQGYPYRQDDFDRYNHRSEKPISVTNLTEVYINLANHYSISIDEDVTSLSYNIHVKDIFSYELSWYPGILVRNVNKNIAIFRTTEYALSSNENTFDMQVPLIYSWTKGQTVDVYPVLSQTKYTGNPDSSPAIPNMYYLGSGNTGLTILSSFIPGSGYEVVGYPTITYNTTWQNNREYYWIRDIGCTLNNTGTYSQSVYVRFSVEGDDGMNYEVERFTTLVSPGQQKTVATSCSIYLPTSYNKYMYLNVGITEQTTGNGGTIFSEQFDLVNNDWMY